MFRCFFNKHKWGTPLLFWFRECSFNGHTDRCFQCEKCGEIKWVSITKEEVNKLIKKYNLK